MNIIPHHLNRLTKSELILLVRNQQKIIQHLSKHEINIQNIIANLNNSRNTTQSNAVSSASSSAASSNIEQSSVNEQSIADEQSNEINSFDVMKELYENNKSVIYKYFIPFMEINMKNLAECVDTGFLMDSTSGVLFNKYYLTTDQISYKESVVNGKQQITYNTVESEITQTVPQENYSYIGLYKILDKPIMVIGDKTGTIYYYNMNNVLILKLKVSNYPILQLKIFKSNNNYYIVVHDNVNLLVFCNFLYSKYVISYSKILQSIKTNKITDYHLIDYNIYNRNHVLYLELLLFDNINSMTYLYKFT